ncbi:MAG: efflux RND transporter periplasmic adaptor subunit [Gemmatimonas sp.]|uniref:efflux RND transporter periplasmic adaptor subunit n=3 Tax=Gemmatimonas sp. TaxID=1962908 RepID=UPI0022CCC7BE|nr:efflux RND transporter periplasmic adaptor subunit [Gemmatimonas sp.]MCA2986799.1 efflux RND transporter periplasmic adaptor subunit [Gemmatimonas sp.]MCA2993370.1 efflux RND transporter periplasmic adaptor subunit [Gemmatimonas sp.]MCZ8010914.1 efflux RND transporter periplasmic adaptor subunit [Gemmatimonas sp.]MCZ8266266.1 efflux RND transporter periplasmic adaptor subunit [Gemmatimonas sp.]
MRPSTRTPAMALPARFPRTPLLLVAPLLAACGRNGDTAATDAPTLRAAPVPVTVATLNPGDSMAVVTATGTFESRDEIPLAFKIGGVVTRVLVDEGATVQRGQILASLDLREIDAAVAKAQVATDKAQRDQARVQRLAADSVATLAQLQDATSALDAARADLATARVNRDYAVITAPEAGIVLRREVAPGSTVGPGTTVMTMGGTRRGRVLRAGVPDRDALRIRVGDAATAHFDALPRARFEGKVILVGRAADPRTGTYAVEVSLTGADALPSGLVGQLRIAVKGKQVAMRIPVDALLEADRDSATVYTIRVDSAGAPVAAPQRVAVGALSGDQVHINGLAPEARVITRGATYVTAGVPVRIITTPFLDSITASTTARAALLTAAAGRRTP